MVLVKVGAGGVGACTPCTWQQGVSPCSPHAKPLLVPVISWLAFETGWPHILCHRVLLLHVSVMGLHCIHTVHVLPNTGYARALVKV